MQFFLIAGFIYLCLCLMLLARQNGMLFPAPSASYDNSLDDLQLIDGPDGEVIALQFRMMPRAHGLVIYAHGNAVDIGMLSERRRYFENMGLAFCAYDYPGYGLSSGAATESACYATVDHVVAYLQSRADTAALPLIWYGRSIGSGPALYAAEKHGGRALILESAMLSAQKALLPLRMFPWDFFDNEARIGQLSMPILFIHGQRDSVVPFTHGQALAVEAGGQHQQCWLPDHGHNDIGFHLEAVDTAIRRFIEDLSLAPAAEPR